MAERRSSSVVGRDSSVPLEKWRKGLAIDQDAVNEEDCNHAESFEHVGHQLALAEARRDKAKYDLELAEARVSNKIRDEANNSQRKHKLAEGEVTAEVALDKDVQDCQEALLRA